MRERPILFSGPMVNALLSGQKTQSRRVVHRVDNAHCIPVGKRTVTHVLDAASRCPYGVVGDRLWVRETFQYESKTADFEWDVHNCIIRYRATEPDAGPWLTAEDDLSDAWRPSIHMPRWASRLLLEITDVRVERLQDISASDATAEGVDGLTIDGYAYVVQSRSDARLAFHQLWDSINATRAAWSSNPWVWVLTFTAITPDGAPHGH